MVGAAGVVTFVVVAKVVGVVVGGAVGTGCNAVPMVVVGALAAGGEFFPAPAALPMMIRRMITITAVQSLCLATHDGRLGIPAAMAGSTPRLCDTEAPHAGQNFALSVTSWPLGHCFMFEVSAS